MTADHTSTDAEPQRSTTILQVEDNPGDARFTREAFEATAPDVDLEVVETGAAALDHLDEDGTAIPALILLDLNLDALSGFDVLRELESDPELDRIPVVVFSDSEAPTDVRESYAAGANAYVRKPPDAPGYFDVIERLAGFWLAVGVTPTEVTDAV